MDSEDIEIFTGAVDRVVDALDRNNAQAVALGTKLHEIRSGTPMSPGLAQHTLQIRDLENEGRVMREKQDKLEKNVELITDSVRTMQAEGKVLAWKVGLIIAVLVYVANLVTPHLKIFG